MNKKNIEVKFYIVAGLLAVITILGIILVFSGSGKNYESKDYSLDRIVTKRIIKKSGIVLETINGVIQFNVSQNMLGFTESGISSLIDRIYSYAENPNVEGMIIRINSPGGTIGAVQEVYNAIKAFRSHGKIVVASFGDIAASGGYYIASACDKIVSNPGTITGSIGVIIASPSFVKLFKKFGLGYNVIKSGAHKDILSPYREMTPEEHKIIQGVVDNAYYQFLNAVSSGRNIKIQKLKKYADGRIFTGAQAKKINLVDVLGDLHTAVRLVGKLTGLGSKPHIIKPSSNPIEQIFSQIKRDKSFAEVLLQLYEKSPVPVFYLYQQ